MKSSIIIKLNLIILNAEIMNCILILILKYLLIHFNFGDFKIILSSVFNFGFDNRSINLSYLFFKRLDFSINNGGNFF